MKKNNLKLKIFLINFILIFSVFFIIFDFWKKIEDKNEENFSDNEKNIDQEKIPETVKVVEKNQDLISYKIHSVLDWDTIKIFYKNWEKKSVRMTWLDTPESYKTRFWYKECFWDEAWDFLKKLIWDSEFVQIEIDETQWEFDKYNRLLAYVFLDWKNLNDEMIKNWYWWEYTYRKEYKYQNDFQSSEKYASENDLWLWAVETCNWERKKFDD